MSVHQVLVAAAALRDFTVQELAAYCDEHPPDIVDILGRADQYVQRTAPDADLSAARWRVVDLDGLRRALAACSATSPPGGSLTRPRHFTGASLMPRLLLAEQVLSECATAESVSERRIMVATAKNYLRQVVAGSQPERRSWSAVEFSLDRLGEAVERRPDELVCTRLWFDVALVCLAEYDVAGQAVPVWDLVDVVLRFQQVVVALEDPRLRDLIGCFFDLVLAQLGRGTTSSIPAPRRLIAAVARRRVRAQVEHSVRTAMSSLVPLMESLELRGLAQGQGLYRLLSHLPDGRDRVAVYSDLLQILPRQWTWQPTGELLPGALVEAVTDSEASRCLAHCAETLESDLVRSPFFSDAALIGQVAHIFQELADQVASLDDTVRTRSDRTRSELLGLAKLHGWTAQAATGEAR